MPQILHFCRHYMLFSDVDSSCARRKDEEILFFDPLGLPGLRASGVASLKWFDPFLDPAIGVPFPSAASSLFAGEFLFPDPGGRPIFLPDAIFSRRS